MLAIGAQKRRVRHDVRRYFAWLFAVAIAIGVVAAPDAGAAPSAAWTVESFATPTNLRPGSESVYDTTLPSIQIRAYNVGGAAAEGVEITDVLPAEVSVLPGAEVGAIFGTSHGSLAPADCTVIGAVITCREPEVGPEATVNSGEMIVLQVPIAVSASAVGQEENEVTISGDGGPPATSRAVVTYADGPASFSFLPGPNGAHGSATLEEGQIVTQAGAHPFQVSFGFGLPVEDEGNSGQLGPSGGGVKNLSTILPKGMVVNPQAVSKKCAEAELEDEVGGVPSCPVESQVGTVALSVGVGGAMGGEVQPLFEMNAPRGNAAVLGFHAVGGGVFFHLIGRVNSSGEYELAASGNDISDKLPISQVTVTLWGNPSAEEHDAVRGSCATLGGSCATGRSGAAFVSMPSHCTETGLTAKSSADSWSEPGTLVGRSYLINEADGGGSSVSGCGQLAFLPSISAQLTTAAGDSPSGLSFGLHQPQDLSYSSLATAILKVARVSLPEGVALNPAAANGLAACSEAEIGFAPANGKILFSEEAQTCPAASKVGSVEVSTPLLDHKLPGALYVAAPFQNPFDSLLAIYLVVEDEQSGIVAKLAGRVDPDTTTGRLTATFEESPELPLEDVSLQFFEGPRAVLTSPLVCGDHTTASDLTPWSTPEGADAGPSSTFQIETNCASSEAAAPKAASFAAGTMSPVAGAHSPFALRVSRADGSQHVAGIETTLPTGLLGKLAGIPYCPDSAIARAKSREVAERGREEAAAPSCPSSSEIGSVQVTAGSGAAPIPVSGRVYLAGPYKSAPLSLVVIVPALAGPFDLGTVVDRVALNVGTYDARIHAVADPLPTIRDGIPLDVRSIDLNLNRPGFVLNPTSCAEKIIRGSLFTQAAQTVPLSTRFQVGGCKRLAFKPRLKLSLRGGTGRAAHPRLRAVVTYPKKGVYANIARAQVSLPHSEFLDQSNLNKVCKQADLLAGTCPEKAVYGRVKAWTPLLDRPLEGKVYLGVGFGYKLPALVAELDGQIRILLKAKIDSDKQGGIRSTFETVPDAKVERFVLELKGGGKYGLFENSENLCKAKQVAGSVFRAQNGSVLAAKIPINNTCKSSGTKRGPGRRHS